MKISKGSLSFKLWALTFFCSPVCPPELTTPRRFWTRLLFMPLVLIIFSVCVSIVWIAQTVIGNAFTILTGLGVCVTWDEPWNPRIRRFQDVSIHKDHEEIPVWGIVMMVWTGLALFALWYWHLDVLFKIALYAVGIIVMFLIIGFIIAWADYKESDDFPRLLRIAREALRKGDQPGGEVLGFYSKDKPEGEID